MVAALTGYLCGLAVVQRGWFAVYQTQGEGDRPIVDDSGLAARLIVGAVALAPVGVAVLAGWLVGRRSTRCASRWSAGRCAGRLGGGWPEASSPRSRSPPPR